MRIKYVIAILLISIPLIFTSCLSVTPTTTTPTQEHTQETTTQPSQTETPTPAEPEPTSSPTPSTTPPSQDLAVHFIDVGQGDSILIDYGQTEILIDGGDRSPGVVTYLSSFVDGELEVMIVTHPHADHIGGLIAVLQNFDVDEIWHNGDTSTSQTYEDFMALVNSEGAEVHVARLHDIIVAGDLSLKVHHPADIKDTTNNNSVVLHLAYGEIDFLFMGDAEVEAEQDMMMLSSLRLPEVEILKAGHHGSRTASSVEFLNITTPETAIYMCGIDNTYGHPHEETIQALDAIGADIYGTDVNGTIILTTDGNTYDLILEKESQPADTETPSTPETAIDEPVDLIEKSDIPDTILSRNYAWYYQTEWTWQLDIPEAAYDYYRELPRPPTQNYSVYVTHPSDDPYIDMLVERIEAAAEKSGFSEYVTIELAAAFVQSLPYALDSVTSPYDEYPRYPIETLVDEGGDCEDTSILLASLIHSMGYGVVLIEFPNHCGIGIKGGENVYGTYYEYGGSKYFYLETTGENWGIGKLPDEYKGVSAQIYPMVPTPILTHEWTVTGEGFYAVLEVKVTNLGTATANNVYVYAGFDAGNDKLWNSVQSNTVSIEPGYQYTTTLYIQVPLGKHTRLVVQIAMDGYSVENSYSEWFDT